MQSSIRINRRNGRVLGKEITKPPSILQWSGLIRLRSLGLAVLLVAVLSSGLSVVYTAHQNRFAFNGLQELKDQSNELETKWGQLLIEQSTFGLEGRIERKAVNQLQMEVPDLSNIVMVQHD